MNLIFFGRSASLHLHDHCFQIGTFPFFVCCLPRAMKTAGNQTPPDGPVIRIGAGDGKFLGDFNVIPTGNVSGPLEILKSSDDLYPNASAVQITGGKPKKLKNRLI